MFKARKLTSEEIEMLQSVYADGLDCSKIRVRDNHWTTAVPRVGAFVVGNNIQIGEKYIGDRTILIHEAAHVWQFQGEWGWKYFLNAMFDHLRSYFGGHNPYDYSAVEGRLPWDKWNAEQQAQWIGEHESLPTPEIIEPGRKI
jgi:hypothetical protein